MPVSSKALCLHRNFSADVAVAIIEDAASWVAEVSVKCTDCGEKFRFTGVPAGFNPNQPMTSIDGCELRAPIAPVGDRPILARASSYTMPKVTKVQ